MVLTRKIIKDILRLAVAITLSGGVNFMAAATRAEVMKRGPRPSLFFQMNISS
jgi:hypothetical protein